MQKLPFCIYADFKSLNVKICGCDQKQDIAPTTNALYFKPYKIHTTSPHSYQYGTDIPYQSVATGCVQGVCTDNAVCCVGIQTDHSTMCCCTDMCTQGICRSGSRNVWGLP